MNDDQDHRSEIKAQVIDFTAAKERRAAMSSGEGDRDNARPTCPTCPTLFADGAGHTSVASHAADSGRISELQSAPSRNTSLVSCPSGAPRFALFPDGVYEMPEPGEGDPVYICTPLRVDAVFSDKSGAGRGRLVSIQVDGRWREIQILNSAIQCHPREAIKLLVDQGLEIAPGKKSNERLMTVLKTWTSDIRLQTVKRMGWTDDSYRSFTLGNSRIGESDRPPLASANAKVSGLVTRGSKEDWKTQVGMLCNGNPLMILAASLAFSGPLLRPLNMPGLGLHFRGETSCGKSTLLKLATSVWGSEQLITKWNATSNGLEALASTVNDMLLPLDEIGEISAAELYKAAYTLADGKGKARAKSDGTLAEQAEWRLALISTGELSVSEKLRESRRGSKDGQEVRIIDIEADARTYGAFDTLHGAVNGSAFADKVQAALGKAYGTPGRAFVKQLIGIGALKKDFLRQSIDRRASNWIARLPSAPDGQIARVATRFATISLAGSLATHFGLTGWGETAPVQVAEQAFRDWYDRRYADKREAVDGFVQPMQDFLKANLNALADLKAPRTGVDPTLGWRDETKAYLKRTTWDRIYPNADGARAAKALIDMNLLVKGDGKHQMHRAPSAIPGRPRLYTVNIARVMAYKPD